jgi:hypothetical protein
MSRQTPQTPPVAGPIEPPPFSRAITVEELLRRPDEPYIVEPTPEEMIGLARLLRIPNVLSLKGSFRVARLGPFVNVTGKVRGRVSQTCVVTLEDFESDIEEDVDVRFAPEPRKAPEPRPGARMSRKRAEAQEAAKAAPPPTFDEEGDEDPPDLIVDGRIDLGALAGEFLALGLDPYPRKPDAAFDLGEPEPDRDSPFAALSGLGKPKDDAS